jgi:hypothetical protein
VHKNQRVSDMVNEVLARQARTQTKQTGVAFEDALESVLETVAGWQLRELRDGPHGGTRASQWQGGLQRGRRRVRVQAAREQFMLTETELRESELRESKLRKESQLV